MAIPELLRCAVGELVDCHLPRVSLVCVVPQGFPQATLEYISPVLDLAAVVDLGKRRSRTSSRD